MLTIKQKILLEAIEWFIKENGYSPTYIELGKMLKRSKSNIFRTAMILEEKGYISTKNGKARTMKVLKSDKND